MILGEIEGTGHPWMKASVTLEIQDRRTRLPLSPNMQSELRKGILGKTGTVYTKSE